MAVRADGERGLPSSRTGTLAKAPETGIVEALEGIGVKTSLRPDGLPAAGYRIDRPEDGDGLVVSLAPEIVSPEFDIGGATYRLVLRRGKATAPPVIIKNRPREIVFNVGHPAIGDDLSSTRAALALALEVSFLLPGGDDASGLYDRLLGFVAAL